jgi:Cu-Zn family superoxide dismutase
MMFTQHLLALAAVAGLAAGCADGAESGFAREPSEDSAIGVTPDGRPSEPGFDTTGHGTTVRGAEEDTAARGTAPRGPDGAAMGLDTEEPVTHAVTILHPTEGSQVRGTVEYRAAEPEGVEITASVTGLPQGRHALHVHVYGDCTAPDATSAGPHYPYLPSDTLPEPDMITGDIGELEADADGTASLTTVIPTAELDGSRSILGRAVVVHASGNDPSAPPDGNAGDRLACGVIGAAAG